MNIALITARGGSKGLRGKNISDLKGMPLIAWTIEAAKKSGAFEVIYVSTDSRDIKRISREFGALIIDRPLELATDTASSEDAIAHAISYLKLKDSDLVMLLQPTSPLRNANDIIGSLDVYDSSEDCKGVISVYEPGNTPAKAYKMAENGQLTGLLSPDAPYERRQDLPRCFQPNGAIYLFGTGDFNVYKGIPKSGIYPFIMEEERSMDVDTKLDLIKIEDYLSAADEK